MLTENGWQVVHNIINDLLLNQTIFAERNAATVIKDKFSRFGTKQSRNLLQSLGLTKFEIPLDSRITKWLNDFGFPIKLYSTALSDEDYYNFILDEFQKISKAIGVYPCVLDAVIFSSFDDEWTEDKLVW